MVLKIKVETEQYIACLTIAYELSTDRSYNVRMYEEILLKILPIANTRCLICARACWSSAREYFVFIEYLKTLSLSSVHCHNFLLESAYNTFRDIFQKVKNIGVLLI